MVPLEDIFQTGDFRAAVNGLTHEIRGKHELPPIHQLGLVVSDDGKTYSFWKSALN